MKRIITIILVMVLAMTLVPAVFASAPAGGESVKVTFPDIDLPYSTIYWSEEYQGLDLRADGLSLTFNNAPENFYAQYDYVDTFTFTVSKDFSITVDGDFAYEYAASSVKDGEPVSDRGYGVAKTGETVKVYDESRVITGNLLAEGRAPEPEPEVGVLSMSLSVTIGSGEGNFKLIFRYSDEGESVSKLPGSYELPFASLQQELQLTFVPETVPIEAKPSASKVLVNGTEVTFNAYNINGNNYFKLRDLAMALTGTEKQFDITFSQQDWGDVISLAGYLTPYTPVGGELTPGDGTVKTTYASKKEVAYMFEGELDNYGGGSNLLRAYLIDGSNYFRIRDILRIVNIYLGYDETSQVLTLDTSKSYVDE